METIPDAAGPEGRVCLRLWFRAHRLVLLLLGLVSLVGMPYSVLMPVFAREILHGGDMRFSSKRLILYVSRSMFFPEPHQFADDG